MVPLTGYADRFSAAPGETIAFQLSSHASEPYEARLIRVICGDPNPDGPGIKEEDHTSVFAGTYASRVQPVSFGSYARVPHAHAFDGLNQFTVIATIWPTTSQARRQGLVAKYDAVSGTGFALYIDGRGAGACIGTGAGRSFSSRVGKPLRERSWYRVWAAYDASTRTLSVGQFPLQPSVGADDAGSVSMTSPGSASAVLETSDPLLIAALGGSPVTGHFNGKIEGPTILGRALDADNIATAATAQSDLIARWDFSRDISSAHIVDVGPHGLQGELINLPARAMTGSNWTGEEMCWRHAPEQYGAIHFHEDDIYDCGWETDFRFTVPEEMLTMYNTVPGLPAESLIRADMVYFETPNGGAVFSVGSITFCGSLAHHHYDNNISRIVNNVLTRFRQ